MKKWYYNGVADITIGEVQESKAPKIILIILIVILVALAGLAIGFKDYIHDLFVIPEIILRTNEISIELDSEFNAESYIISKIEDGENYSITGDTVYTNVLDAEYTVIYTIWNRVNSSSTELKVKIVDDTAPTIKLSSNNKKIKLDENNSFTLILGESTETTLGTDDFNVLKDILVEVSDNHTSKEDLLSTLKISPENPDYDLEEGQFSKNITIRFEITDEVGLTSNAHILITVVNGVIEIIQTSTETSTAVTTTTTEVITTTTSTSATTAPPVTSSSSNPPVNTTAPPPSTTASTTPKPAPQPSGAYINGVHDVTVKVGTGLQVVVDKLLDGVYGSGYITVEYRKVNPTIVGDYTVTFTSSDGIVKTCTVHVVE